MIIYWKLVNIVYDKVMVEEEEEEEVLYDILISKHTPIEIS